MRLWGMAYFANVISPRVRIIVLCACAAVLCSCSTHSDSSDPNPHTHVVPDQSRQSPSKDLKGTQPGEVGSLAGTTCTSANDCGPNLVCDLSRGVQKAVCVERVNPSGTPRPQ